MNRRKAIACLLGGAAAPAVAQDVPNKVEKTFRLRYLLSSAMYGEMALEEILPEVKATGCEGIDIWCRVHGNQREQIDRMGHRAAGGLFMKHQVQPKVFTRYPLGPFKLQGELKVARFFGAEMVICGTTGPSEPSGEEAKKAVREFLEKMKPHAEVAEEMGVKIVLENHDKQLLYHPDSLRYFAEFNRSKGLGIALAFHHLHRFVPEIPKLIRELGNEQIPFIYFQEHSAGIREKVAKEIEMQQMPGFGGGLDYRPIVRALMDIDYRGYVEIFMHPVPRGIPILPTVKEVSAAINRSRAYVEACLEEARQAS